MAGDSAADILRKARENMETIKNDRQLIRMDIASIQDQLEKLCEAYMRACDLDAECMNELNSPPFDRNGVSHVDARVDTSQCDGHRSSPRMNTSQGAIDHALVRGDSDLFDWSDFNRGCDGQSIHEFNSDDERPQMTSLPRNNTGELDLDLYVWDQDIPKDENESRDETVNNQHHSQENKQETHFQTTGKQTNLKVNGNDSYKACLKPDTKGKFRKKDRVNENLYRMLRKTFHNKTSTAIDFDFDCPNYQPKCTLLANTDEAGESLAERFSMEDMEKEIDNFYVMRNQIPRDPKADISDDDSETSGTETNTSSMHLDEIMADELTKDSNIDFKNASPSKQRRKRRQPTNEIRTFSQSTLLMNKSITMLTKA